MPKPTSFHVSASGTKAAVKVQIDQQVGGLSERGWLKSIVDNAAGSHASISGSWSTDRDASHGNLSITGSFWTPAAR